MGLGYKSDERKLEGFTNYIFNSKGFSKFSVEISFYSFNIFPAQSATSSLSR
jgi:hypothetical protein